MLRLLPRIRAFALLIAIASGCTSRSPSPESVNRQAATSSADALLDTLVPSAGAGDSGWKYQQRVTVDLNDDGATEDVVLISDVTLDTRGRPVWEDGHRWQVYVEDHAGGRTRLYARFLPNGKLSASVARAANGSPTILLLEQTPHRTGLYEIEYRGSGQAIIAASLVRQTDVDLMFAQASRR
jgi:hypothetical protein